MSFGFITQNEKQVWQRIELQVYVEPGKPTLSKWPPDSELSQPSQKPLRHRKKKSGEPFFCLFVSSIDCSVCRLMPNIQNIEVTCQDFYIKKKYSESSFDFWHVFIHENIVVHYLYLEWVFTVIKCVIFLDGIAGTCGRRDLWHHASFCNVAVNTQTKNVFGGQIELYTNIKKKKKRSFIYAWKEIVSFRLSISSKCLLFFFFLYKTEVVSRVILIIKEVK